MSKSFPRAVLGIYGISDRGQFPTPRWTHDHGLALIVEGRIIWALELERITRIKHDNRLGCWIEALINDGVVQLPESFVIASVDSLVGRCFVSATGRWRVEADHASLSSTLPLQEARASVGTMSVPAFVVPHEASHVGASLPFFEDWDNDTLLVHIDGGASQCNASAWRWRDGRMEHLHHDWDTLWAVLNFGYNDLIHEILGLNEDNRMAAPGRLMGLAGYGNLDEDIRMWLEQHDWFRRHWQRPGEFAERALSDWGWSGRLSDLQDPFVLSLAAAVQAHFEDVVIGWVERALVESRCSRVVLSGGAALNINANTKMRRILSSRSLQVPPCCNDSGLALGAAALTWRILFGPLTERQTPFLQSVGLGPMVAGGHDLDITIVAELLAAGKIVAWYQGEAEVGPRALGHRSLLCAPNSIELKKRISESVKRREWYRPVAPAVLQELAGEVFPGAEQSELAPYMLESFPVADSWRERIPGVVHVDGTARVQTVGGHPENDRLRELLKVCWERHRLPCLINTSFNGPGQPIVHRRDDAFALAQQLGVDAIVIDDRFFPLPNRASEVMS